MKINRIFHPYWLWEDAKNGQYDLSNDYSELEEERLAIKVKEFLSNQKEFYDTASKVIKEWKYSSEHNLSNVSLNRQAWLGQACCCYKFGIPERITKLGWFLMDIDSQVSANKTADKIIKLWEGEYAKKLFKQKCL